MKIYFETKEETIKKLVLKSKSLIIRVKRELNQEIDKFVLARQVSDLYYSLFYLAEALLLIKGEFKIKKHSTVNYLISKHYKELSYTFGNLFRLRNEADYTLDFAVTKEEIEQLIKEVKEFYNKTLEYLKKEKIINEKEMEDLKL